MKTAWAVDLCIPVRGCANAKAWRLRWHACDAAPMLHLNMRENAQQSMVSTACWSHTPLRSPPPGRLQTPRRLHGIPQIAWAFAWLLLSPVAAAADAPDASSNAADGTERNAADAAAGRQGSEARAMSLSRSLQSPYCPGRTLWDCPSGPAGEMREDIRTWTDQGLSSQEIRRRLEEKAPGFDFLGGTQAKEFQIFPYLILGLSLVVLAWVVHRAWYRWRRQPGDRADEGDASAWQEGVQQSQRKEGMPPEAAAARQAGAQGSLAATSLASEDKRWEEALQKALNEDV